MSFFEKTSYSSSYNDKDDSIPEQDSPRRLKVALKHIQTNACKCHMDEKNHSPITDDHDGSASNEKPVADKTNQSSSDDIEHQSTDDEFGYDTEFRVYCKCDECLQYREVLIQLVLEDHEYNTLWDRLKALIREFYDIIPQNPKPYEGSMEEKYDRMMKTQARWFTDGQIDQQKSIQLSLSSQLPMSNEMTFVLVFSMLCSRDRHQLFELLCIQLRCITIAYSDGLRKLFKFDEPGKAASYDPVELLTFILDGYDRLCSTAKKISSLLFELQRDHLQKFELTWTILNKRMYQRYVYMGIQEMIPECILKLKDLLEPEKYSTMAHRLIRFDEDMTSITKTWADVWALLQTYHMTDKESERRNRMGCIQELFKAIRVCEFDFEPHDSLLNRENSAKMSWTKLDNRDDAWILAIHYLKNVWSEKDDTRLYSSIQNERCITCYSSLTSHYADCDCMTCLFAGGPCNTQALDSLEKYYCTRCSFYEKLDRDYVDYIKKDLTRKLPEINDKSKKSLPSLTLDIDDDNDDTLDGDLNDFMLMNHCYHLSWAIFKHLPTRKAYNVASFDAHHFCSFQDPPCMRNECRVATHIIAGLYPLNFSKFLIKAYQPLKEDERTELMNIQKLYFSYLMQKVSNDKIPKVDMLSQMDLLWNVDDAEYTLFCDIGSAFAECYLIDMAIPVQELLDSCFICDNNDIELNMYWLECIYMFKESDNSPLKKIENNPKVLEFQLRMQMDQVGTMNDVSKFTAATTRVLASTSERRQQMKKGESSSSTSTSSSSLSSISKKDHHQHESKENNTSINKIKPETYERLMHLLDHMKKEPKKDEHSHSHSHSHSIDDDSKECMHNKVKVVITRKKQTDATTSSPCRDTKCKKYDACDKDNPTDSDVTLADAVKIAVKQQLNQKLEAELKSLKKEHSVLKDMVRDLEQIKENDENQLITKKEKITVSSNGNHHCCSEHSDMLENHANHPKMCHRGDGQCTCYYCTIFGHAQECSHGRSNETRDRLRKRLHQIHSKSSTKTHSVKSIKNQPGALKKMLVSKVGTQNNINGNNSASLLLSKQHHHHHHHHHHHQQLSKPVVEQKENNANEMIEAALQENWSKLDGATGSKNGCNKTTTSITSSPITAATDPKTAKKRKLFNTIKSDYQHLYECETGMCEACDGKNKMKPISFTNGTLEAELTAVRRTKAAQVFTDQSASLDDILDFIEGNNTSKKDSQKKAAKKAKQKQKKEDVKRLEELEQLRDQFHDAFFRESDVKNDLKNLRSMKKRDKKKIAELETSIKKYGKFKCKIETNILELIGALKTNNSEFKFAYLPTKEQQLEKQQQLAQNQTSTIAVNADQAKVQNEKSSNVRIIQHDQRQDVQQTCEISLDQSKRMVTIRRINIPHAEPQVTVTAKGISPDKDKLLYTFINGQLIPSANVTATAQQTTNQNGSSEKINDKSVKPKSKTVDVPQTTNSVKSNKKQNEPNVIEKTAKKNIKPDKPTEKVKSNEKNNGRKASPETVKQTTIPAVIATATTLTTTTATTTATESNGKKTIGATNKTAKTVTNNAAKEKEKQQTNKKKASKKDDDIDIDLMVDSTKKLSLDGEEPKKQKKKVKAVKFEYADPNYKVNQFDLLDMDEDDDDYYLESSSDESIDEEPVKIDRQTVSRSQTPSTITAQQTPSIDSQAAQLNKNNNKNNNKTKDKNAKNQTDTNKKAKNDANVKTTVNTTKTDKKLSTETNKVTTTTTTTTKSSQSPATVASTKQPVAIDAIASKKQKKKAQKQQQQQQVQIQQPQPNLVRSKSAIDKPTAKTDNVMNTLNKSMQRMQLNSDTTIEPVNNTNHTANKNSLNVSIMDQLSRGVKVEGLTLPPGITLTRVDPNKADGIRANKESIDRISQPAPLQYQQPLEYQRPPAFLNSVMPMQSNGLIMVDPMQNLATTTAAATTVNTTTQSSETTPQPTSKKNRKNKKKNKNKNEEENANSDKQQEPKIVTLRNPLFQGNGDLSKIQRSMPLQQQNQIPLNINQPASIIKNDNGMFTIRNMALHQALSNGVAQNYRPYASDMYQQQPQQTQQSETKSEDYSYFRGSVSASGKNSPSSTIAQELTAATATTTTTTTNAKTTPASHMAIGSEMKNAQQMKNSPWYPSVSQNQQPQSQQQTYGSINGDIFNNMTHLNPKRSYSPFDVSANFGFNSDFIGSAQTGATTQQPSSSNQMHNQYFNVNGGFPFNNQTQSDTGSLFGSRTSTTLTNNVHCCDDTPPTQDENSFFKKFEDDSFLHGLHAGQRLNSEVTIHNINDSKFNRKSMPVGLNDGVEITRINGPDNFAANPNLAVGSQRPTSANDDLNNSSNSEFSDNVFKPNAAVNLNELESEERDIETFKRFNYYFDPPKNKPKINFDVKGIVVAKKQPASENSSPYFGELAGSSLSNTPHPEDEFYPELNSFKPINCDPLKPHSTINRIHLDNFLNGIIGDEIKNDQE